MWAAGRASSSLITEPGSMSHVQLPFHRGHPTREAKARAVGLRKWKTEQLKSLMRSPRGCGVLVGHLMQTACSDGAWTGLQHQIVQDPGKEMTVFKVIFIYLLCIFEYSDYTGQILHRPQFLPIATFYT